MTHSNPTRDQSHSIRLKGYDYTRPGVYFVTMLPTPESRPKGPAAGSLGAMIGQFKSRVTKRVWAMPGDGRTPIWQRNFYEHIVRDQRSLERIRCYILENPIHWDEDDLNPDFIIRKKGDPP